MTDREGVIKFNLEHEQTAAINRPIVAELNQWRSTLSDLGLIGADPQRYDGLGFGNLSARLQGNEFLITGSQTGLLDQLTEHHYAHVLGSSLETNSVWSRGSIAPSSEALTHAAIYAANWDIRFVFHCHSPDIWANAAAIGIPVTSEQQSYGTPELAAEVGELVAGFNPGSSGLFAMGGHEDGVVAYARSAGYTGNALVNTLAAARQLAGSRNRIN
jgi:hypothetical protein